MDLVRLSLFLTITDHSEAGRRTPAARSFNAATQKPETKRSRMEGTGDEKAADCSPDSNGDPSPALEAYDSSEGDGGG